MNKEYDIFVIGTGTAGYTLAHTCRKAGKKVGICDNKPMGGTCAMRGCQPKKYLVAATEIAGISGWMSDIGIWPGAEIDWPDLMQSKRKFTDAVPDRIEKSFENAGIEALHGTARFISPDELTVNDTAISATNFVIATGSEPLKLNIPGEEYIKSSDDFLNLSSLPVSMIFIGGGYISMEFAFIAKMAGVEEVTVLEGMNRILAPFDEELAAKLAKSAESLGIQIITDFTVCEVQQHYSSYTVLGDENRTLSHAGDLVIHGAGRRPTLDALNLDDGKIEFSSKGIRVNDYMQSTSNPRVYAIGDVVADSPMLSTVADMEAEIAAENILQGKKLRADYKNIPSVVFSLPQLARVGMTETEAKSAGIDFQTNKGSMTSWPSSRRIGQKTAMYKVLIEKNTKRILGVHVLGHNAGEIINVFALAMKCNLKGEDLKKILWAYPTSTSDLKYMVG